MALVAPLRAEESPAADPATKQAARDLGQSGVDLMAEHKFAEAREKFHQAYQLVPAPTFAVLEARALVELGKLVEAAEAYQLALHSKLGQGSPERLRAAMDEANAELDKLLPRLAGLVVRVTGGPNDTPGLTIRVDETPLPLVQLGIRRPLNPGEHQVRATWTGGQWESGRFALGEGEQREVAVGLSSGAAATPTTTAASPTAATSVPPGASREAPVPADDRGSTQRVFGWTSLGLGGAGLVTGVVAGVVMLNAKSTLDAHCSPVCPPSYADKLDAFRGARTVSWIGYGVGIAGLAAGATLLLTAPRAHQRSLRAVPWIGFAATGVAGQF
jgi:hypothetical protein